MSRDDCFRPCDLTGSVIDGEIRDGKWKDETFSYKLQSDIEHAKILLIRDKYSPISMMDDSPLFCLMDMTV